MASLRKTDGPQAEGPFAGGQGDFQTSSPYFQNGQYQGPEQSAQVMEDPGIGTRDSRVGTTPRENQADQMGQAAAIRRPSTPTSMAGTSFNSGAMSSTPPPGGVLPFQPMGSTDPKAMTQANGLFGSSGGLKGGGLGVPLDPTSNQASDPITTLIQMLTQGMNRGR